MSLWCGAGANDRADPKQRRRGRFVIPFPYRYMPRPLAEHHVGHEGASGVTRPFHTAREVQGGRMETERQALPDPESSDCCLGGHTGQGGGEQAELASDCGLSGLFCCKMEMTL